MVAVRTFSVDATIALGESLAQSVHPGDVVLLSGDLGAGKTQFTKGLARGLGVEGPITSPTFNILLVHPGRIPLNHFDLYRLEHAGQLEDIDYWGTLEADGVSVVEWGDRFPAEMPQDHLLLNFAIVDDDTREISIVASGERGGMLAQELADAAGSIPGAAAGGPEVSDVGGCR